MRPERIRTQFWFDDPADEVICIGALLVDRLYLTDGEKQRLVSLKPRLDALWEESRLRLARHMAQYTIITLPKPTEYHRSLKTKINIRNQEVLKLKQEGMSVPELCERFKLRPNTVYHILSKEQRRQDGRL